MRTTPGVVRMMGSVGQFSWPGASGTDWWADPKEELVVVYLGGTRADPLALPPEDQRAGLSGDRGVARARRIAHELAVAEWLVQNFLGSIGTFLLTAGLIRTYQ